MVGIGQQFTTALIVHALIIMWAAAVLQLGAVDVAEAAAVCPAQDRAALLAFKAGVTSDPSGYLDTWKAQASKANCCSGWRGVTCDAATGRVTILDLTNGRMRGTLSPSLGSLSALRTLSLSQNCFHGPVPSSLGNLTGLVSLALDNMVIDGGDGGLTGGIPASFGNLAALQQLDVSYNKLTGPLPPSIGGMASLQHIRIFNNSIGGPIPASFGQLSNLVNADLAYNRLSGRVPHGFASNLTSLFFLFLDHNRITGLPKDLSNLKRVGIVYLNNNPIGSADRVSGLATLPMLGELHLSSCRLTGPFPQWIAHIPVLQDNSDEITPLISLSDNDLSGPIPPELGNVANLKSLGLDHNRFSGAIPASLGNLTSLQVLSLDHNQLTGGIPSTFVQLQELRFFNVSYNHLSGEIPQQAPFTAFDASSYQPNAGLCGSPLPRCTRPRRTLL